jgi:hypothetical protein
MNDKTTRTRDNKPIDATAQRDPQSKEESSQPPKSRFEKFAATQAAGDGIQGDALKKDKTIDEKIGANMADRK